MQGGIDVSLCAGCALPVHRTNMRSTEDASFLVEMEVLASWLSLCSRLRMRRWLCWCSEGDEDEDEGGGNCYTKFVDIVVSGCVRSHGEKAIDANSDATSLCLIRDCEGNPCLAEEEGVCEKVL